MENLILAAGGVILAVMFSLLILAVLLRAACYLIGEPVPEMGYALVIAIVQTVLGGITLVIVQILSVGVALMFYLEPPPAILLFMLLFSVPAKAAVCAAIYWKMLSISYAKGLGLFVIQAVILALLTITALFIGSFIGPIFAS